MSRWQLDPNKTAMENLFRAASIATSVIMKSHRWYGLQWDTATELFDELRDATVVHFIAFKVKMHRYTRVSKDGRKLTFLDNVLSSCWSASSNIADKFMKDLTKRTSTHDIEPMKYSLSHESRMPLYLGECENKYKANLKKPYALITRPRARADRVRKEYDDYAADCDDLGVTSLSFEAWLASTGYSRDGDMMEWLLTPEERKGMRNPFKNGKFKQDCECTPAELHRRHYQREYRRRKRAEERARLERQFMEVMKDAL